MVVRTVKNIEAITAAVKLTTLVRKVALSVHISSAESKAVPFLLSRSGDLVAHSVSRYRNPLKVTKKLLCRAIKAAIGPEREEEEEEEEEEGRES